VRDSLTLPPRVRRRNLSEGAYLNDLEASRRWKREHAVQADAHNWRTCACGRRMTRRAQQCDHCRREIDAARVQEKRSYIASCWAAGMTVREIAGGLGTTASTVAVEIQRMRRLGWDVPYRNLGPVKRPQG
jgi:DNA-binding CsgD family transcriptional regulator